MAVSKGILEFEENTLCIADTTDIYIYIHFFIYLFRAEHGWRKFLKCAIYRPLGRWDVLRHL